MVVDTNVTSNIHNAIALTIIVVGGGWEGVGEAKSRIFVGLLSELHTHI